MNRKSRLGIIVFLGFLSWVNLLAVDFARAEEPKDKNSILLTIFLKHDQSKTLEEINKHLDQTGFWKWLGFQLLTPEQQKIAFEEGTERPGTGSNLDEHRPGTFVDPITGAPLFRSNAKFESGTGWPSFFDPVKGAITLREDDALGMKRVEVRSASSGIHLGHVFDDGPAPTHKRYCINGNVLKFVPDTEK